MKRIFVVTLSVLLLVAVLVGCNTTPQTTTPTTTPTGTSPTTSTYVPPIPGMKPGEENIKIELLWATTAANTTPPPGIAKTPTEQFCDALNAATGGRLYIKRSYSGVMGNAFELPKLVQSGAVDMSNTVDPQAAEFTLLTMPTPGWYTPDVKTNTEILAQYLYHNKWADQIMAAHNFYDYGANTYAPNFLIVRKGVKQINTVDDLKGLQLGAFSDIAKIWGKGVGMVPVTITVPEGYDTMMKGMVDMLIISLTGFRRFKLNEVSGQVIQTSAGGASPMMLYINKNSWNKMPQYMRDLWTKIYLTDYQTPAIAYELADVNQGTIVAGQSGIKIAPLAAAEEAKMVAALTPAWENWVNEMLKYPAGADVKNFLKDQIAYRNSKLTTYPPFTLYTP